MSQFYQFLSMKITQFIDFDDTIYKFNNIIFQFLNTKCHNLMKNDTIYKNECHSFFNF